MISQHASNVDRQKRQAVTLRYLSTRKGHKNLRLDGFWSPKATVLERTRFCNRKHIGDKSHHSELFLDRMLRPHSLDRNRLHRDSVR